MATSSQVACNCVGCSSGPPSCAPTFDQVNFKMSFTYSSPFPDSRPAQFSSSTNYGYTEACEGGRNTSTLTIKTFPIITFIIIPILSITFFSIFPLDPSLSWTLAEYHEQR